MENSLMSIVLGNDESRRRKSSVVALFSMILCCLLFAVACSDGDPKEPITPPTPKPPTPVQPKPTYMKLLPETANNMTVNKGDSDNHFILETTGHDPYLFTNKISKNNPADSVVLTFEYKSNKALDFIQIFFADPISESRSIKTESVPAAQSWSTWSVTLKKPIEEHAWGSSGQYFRMDFGNDAGYTMEIRNMYLRAMTEEEQKEEEEAAAVIESYIQQGENIKNYLAKSFDSQVTEVVAGEQQIAVNGNYKGDGDYALCEITPYMDIAEIKKFELETTLDGSPFNKTFDRFVDRDGFRYDRTLSKWVIVKKGVGNADDEIVSHARYADEIYASRVTSAEKPTGKKGLGGYFNHGLQTADLDDLGITSVTINVPFTAYIHTQPGGGRIEHSYGGKMFYFDKGQIDALDNSLKECRRRNVVVAAILLIQPAASCPDPVAGRVLEHPDFSGGYYTMPNMTNAESVNMYAAALDFLASRYCVENSSGRIHHWIMHNEVDMGYEWTNMGPNKPMHLYMDAYMKSMRMCYNIARQYDRHSEVFGSFTHSWTKAVSTDNGYPTLDMLNVINDYCQAEGDFQWALAHHPYPQDLNEPKTWNDADANYSTGTSLITFKNLEVLNYWAKQKENLYKGTTKRTVWLSENGTNSRSYEEKDLMEQAAGFAWAWTKLRQLDGIDAMQWHNWYDNPGEFGLRIGLRKFPEDNLAPKEVWYAYQVAGTSKEESYFAKYLPIIGRKDWDILKTIY